MILLPKFTAFNRLPQDEAWFWTNIATTYYSEWDDMEDWIYNARVEELEIEMGDTVEEIFANIHDFSMLTFETNDVIQQAGIITIDPPYSGKKPF